MQRTTRSAVVFVLLLLLGGATGLLARSQGQAQTPPAQGQKPAQTQNPPPGAPAQGQQQPTFRTGINFVRVDVIVNDRQGNAVADLKPGDFEVLEDNKPQKVETFKLINIGSPTEQQLAATEPPREIRTQTDEEFEASREDTRIFAIFLDDYHVRLGSSMAVRSPLMKFLQMQLGPNDLVMVMYPLTPVSALRLTRDHDSVARAVEKFEGRKYNYIPKNEIEQQYQNYPAAIVEQIRNQVSLSALKGLVAHLGGLREGRKAVILVSEGYTNLLPPQLRDPVASLPGMGNPVRNNPAAGETADEQRANFFASADMQGDLRSVYDAANRSNTSIYSLDPRGLATSEFDVSQPTISQTTDRQMLDSMQDTLHVLADNTDGRTIMNRNDIGNGLRTVVKDSSSYYLLGYNSTQSRSDGKFHEIKVRVKRPGVQVRARKGFWAPTAEELKRAEAPPKPEPPAAVTRALANVEEQARGRVIRTWIGTSRGENGKTRVTFVWEPVAQPGSAAAQRPTRVTLTAAGADGRAYFRGRVPDNDAPASAAASAQSADGRGAAAGNATTSSGSRAVFDVPPGKLQLRMAVEGAGAQVIDNDVREIEVPDLTGPRVAITTPMVFSGRTARDFRAIATDPAAVPTARRQFSRTERLLIRFEAVGAGASVPTVAVRLLNRAGQQVAPLEAKAAEGAPSQMTIDLPLAGLAAGEYLIEVKARSEAGESTEMIGIRITS